MFKFEKINRIRKTCLESFLKVDFIIQKLNSFLNSCLDESGFDG